jgi:hypothetical protein
MDPSSIASAYLSSLIHSPGSHFISLEYKPSQQLTRSDLSVWLEGFRCGYRGDIATLPKADEVFEWVDVAMKRFFEWEEQWAELDQLRAQAATAQAATTTIKSEKAMAQSASAESSLTTQQKKSPRAVSVPDLRLGFAAR